MMMTGSFWSVLVARRSALAYLCLSCALKTSAIDVAISRRPTGQITMVSV